MTITREFIEARRTEQVPTRLLSDGRQLWLYPMLFTDRLAIGRAGADSYDDFWCYDDPAAAIRAYLNWDPLDPATPEPEGWSKHKPSGRIGKVRDDDHDAAD